MGSKTDMMQEYRGNQGQMWKLIQNQREMLESKNQCERSKEWLDGLHSRLDMAKETISERNRPLLKCGLVQWYPSQGYSVQRGRKNNCTVEQPDSYFLSQVIKVNAHSHKSCWWFVPLIQCDENDTLASSSPSLSNPTIIMGKTPDIPAEGPSTKCLTNTP